MRRRSRGRSEDAPRPRPRAGGRPARVARPAAGEARRRRSGRGPRGPLAGTAAAPRPVDAARRRRGGHGGADPGARRTAARRRGPEPPGTPRVRRRRPRHHHERPAHRLRRPGERGGRAIRQHRARAPAEGAGSALAASLPRDSQVRIPACRTRTGGHAPAHRGRLGEAFAIGGTACTVKTVESATGVQVDLALTVDFGGFRSMVDALGGVPFTVPQAIDDPSSGFRISAGTHRLNGAQALGYVRVRHGVGDGSDLMRVERQQRFLAALAKRAKDVQTGNPVRFLAFLKAASGSVEMAPRLDLKGLQEVARSLGRTKPGTVRYTTVKVRPDPSDLARLVWDQAAAARLFAHFKTRD
ncbi:LCP family protein [Actinomadura yumaensis]|uniref:LCP family protein n=1 Tax=Actinomadura yumaensis TaxID=111807 RepID=UPI00362136B3